MILLVSSNKDIASQNIMKQLMKNYDFRITEDFRSSPSYFIQANKKHVRLVTLNEESVFAQDIASSFKEIELVVFISRHSSESGKPTLSVHTPGNLADAELGGLPRKVSISPANAMRDTLRAMVRLKKEIGLDYEVSYEGTHHGPSLDVPTMFCELGSSPVQWSDLKAAEAVGRAAMEAISMFGSFQAQAVLGVGGTHYNSKFTRLALESNVAFGHIIPKYAVGTVDSSILEQCLERTLEHVESVVLDWKGIKGEHKASLIKILEETGIRFEKI